MGKNLWNDKEPVSQLEMLEEAEETEEMAAEYDTIEEPYKEVIDEEIVEEIQEESAFDLDSYEVDVVYNARLRLEQARLYEMLINHNLFDGVSADPNAIENVQNEMKKFIVERLEILLGIKSEYKPEPKAIEVELPFNEIEIDFLKQLSYKGTKGASVTGAAPATPQNPLKPFTSKSTANTLKPLVSKPVPPAPAQKVVKKAVQKKITTKPKTTKQVVNKKKPLKTRPILQKANTPQRKIKSNSVGKRQLTKAEVEALARQDLNEMNNRKPWGKMSAGEKIKEIARVNNKHALPRPEGAIPMPTPEQLETKYMNEQSMMSGTNKLFQLNNTIANIIATQKTRGGQDDE